MVHGAGAVNVAGTLAADADAEACDANGQPGGDRQPFRLPLGPFVLVDEWGLCVLDLLHDRSGARTGHADRAHEDHVSQPSTSVGDLQQAPRAVHVGVVELAGRVAESGVRSRVDNDIDFVTEARKPPVVKAQVGLPEISVDDDQRASPRSRCQAVAGRERGDGRPQGVDAVGSARPFCTDGPVWSHDRVDPVDGLRAEELRHEMGSERAGGSGQQHCQRHVNAPGAGRTSSIQTRM